VSPGGKSAELDPNPKFKKKKKKGLISTPVIICYGKDLQNNICFVSYSF
jgi:hypothetical protein